MGGTLDMQEVYKAVEALMVIHNLAIDLDDHPEEIWDYDSTDESSIAGPDNEDADNWVLQEFGHAIVERLSVPGRETDTWLRTKGYAMRIQLLNKLCPIGDYI